MTYTVSNGTSNSTIPYHTCVCRLTFRLIMAPRLPGTSPTTGRPTGVQFAYPRYSGTTYPGDSPYSYDKKLSVCCRRRSVSWKCAALVLLFVVIALFAVVSYLLGLYVLPSALLFSRGIFFRKTKLGVAPSSQTRCAVLSQPNEGK